jgi:hypothetical protein
MLSRVAARHRSVRSAAVTSIPRPQEIYSDASTNSLNVQSRKLGKGYRLNRHLRGHDGAEPGGSPTAQLSHPSCSLEPSATWAAFRNPPSRVLRASPCASPDKGWRKPAGSRLRGSRPCAVWQGAPLIAKIGRKTSICAAGHVLIKPFPLQASQGRYSPGWRM